MRALLSLVRPACGFVSRAISPSRSRYATHQIFTASARNQPWGFRGFTSSRILGTVYEDVRRELRWKKRKKLIRLGLKKRKRKKKRRGKGIWAEPCKAEQERQKDHSRCIIAPYADAQMWPRMSCERDRRHVLKALNTTLVHFGQINSTMRRDIHEGNDEQQGISQGGINCVVAKHRDLAASDDAAQDWNLKVERYRQECSRSFGWAKLGRDVKLEELDITVWIDDFVEGCIGLERIVCLNLAVLEAEERTQAGASLVWKYVSQGGRSF
ncbi:hypothetical protein SELMODRAFT_420597 [Selaginella moellendorffii]|uniref:Uncharacterized protein n=1 Tax=Selaginella moellendorffii TaxID=88036 RepID=D8SCH7_SELML|nr:hypothetical protein SELMODRAFT_420597 [Selaginella moellendorffii]